MKNKTLFLASKELEDYLYKFSKVLTFKEKVSLLHVYEDLLIRSALDNKNAMFELGQFYENDAYLTPNPFANASKCLYWYSKATNFNHPEACNMLATIYESGICCKRSLRKALYLYEKGSKLGYDISKENLHILIKEINDKNHKYFNFFKQELNEISNEEKAKIEKKIKKLIDSKI
ncbi:MAG: hypothetical protein N4A45_09580 [Flavobacteriales bacterium]|nr:hypothetical protein [Flavobacteriales bacterium]